MLGSIKYGRAHFGAILEGRGPILGIFFFATFWGLEAPFWLFRVLAVAWGPISGPYWGIAAYFWAFCAS